MRVILFVLLSVVCSEISGQITSKEYFESLRVNPDQGCKKAGISKEVCEAGRLLFIEWMRSEGKRDELIKVMYKWMVEDRSFMCDMIKVPECVEVENMIWEGVDVFSGKCDGDCENGYGIKRYDLGFRYEGFFKAGKMHGEGLLRKAGDIFKGEFADNEFQSGRIKFDDGRIFEGHVGKSQEPYTLQQTLADGTKVYFSGFDVSTGGSIGYEITKNRQKGYYTVYFGMMSTAGRVLGKGYPLLKKYDKKEEAKYPDGLGIELKFWAGGGYSKRGVFDPRKGMYKVYAESKKGKTFDENVNLLSKGLYFRTMDLESIEKVINDRSMVSGNEVWLTEMKEFYQTSSEYMSLVHLQSGGLELIEDFKRSNQDFILMEAVNDQLQKIHSSEVFNHRYKGYENDITMGLFVGAVVYGVLADVNQNRHVSSSTTNCDSFSYKVIETKKGDWFKDEISYFIDCGPGGSIVSLLYNQKFNSYARTGRSSRDQAARKACGCDR